MTTGEIIKHEVWHLIWRESSSDGTIREYYGKQDGITGDVKIIEYKISNP